MNLVPSSSSVEPFIKSAKHGTQVQPIGELYERTVSQMGWTLEIYNHLLPMSVTDWCSTPSMDMYGPLQGVPPPTHQAPCTPPLTALPFLHSIHQPEQHTYVSASLSCIWHSSTPEPREDEDIRSQKT